MENNCYRDHNPFLWIIYKNIGKHYDLLKAKVASDFALLFLNPLSLSPLRQLTYIYKKCHNEPDGTGIAALTSEERTRWAKVIIYTLIFFY